MKICFVILSMVFSSQVFAAPKVIRSAPLAEIYKQLVAIDSRVAGGKVEYSDSCQGDSSLEVQVRSLGDIRQNKTFAYKDSSHESLRYPEAFVSYNFVVLEKIYGKESLRVLAQYLGSNMSSFARPWAVLRTYKIFELTKEPFLPNVFDELLYERAAIILDPTTAEALEIRTFFGGTNECDRPMRFHET